MLVNREFDHDIDLEDPLAGANNNYILTVLRRLCEDKCFKGIFVKKVTSIVMTGPTRISACGSPHAGTKTVRFAAECLRYTAGDVITGCKIITKTEDSGLQCRGDRVEIRVNPSQYTPPLAVDMIIPVVVRECFYQPYARYVVIEADVFVPPTAPTVYKITKSDSDDDSIYEDVRARIAAETAKLPALQEGGTWKVFSTLIYGSQQTVPGQVDIATGAFDRAYLVLDPALAATVPAAVPAASPPTNAGAGAGVIAVPLTSSQARLCALEYHYRRLKTLREMSEVYNNPDIFKAHAALWRVYKNVAAAKSN